MGEGDFAALHDLIGDAPVFCESWSCDALDVYGGALMAARDILQMTYSFDVDNTLNW